PGCRGCCRTPWRWRRRRRAPNPCAWPIPSAAASPTDSEGELPFHRHVVARLVPAAHVAVDGHILQPVRSLRRQQQMVDADAVVAPPGAGLEIPEGIARLVRHRPQGIGKAEIGEAAEAGEALWPVERVAPPVLGVPGIRRTRDDIEVPEQYEGFFKLEASFDEGRQP